MDGDEPALGIRAGVFVEPEGVDEWIDARRLVATSGLADCHAHLGAASIEEMTHHPMADDERIAANVRKQLAGGVLLLADKGTRDPRTLEVLGWQADRRPELQMAGRVIAAPGGYYEGFAIEVEGVDLPEAVEQATGGGASWVKLIGDWPRRGVGAIPNYAEDELRSAVEVAHADGCRVAIHTAAPETPSMAVAAGVDSIEHGLFLTEHDLVELGRRGGAWVPTVKAMEALAKAMKPESSGRRLLSQGLANLERILGGAPARGVAVLAGTDLNLDHGRVAEEILALRRRGLDPLDALAAGTEFAYRHLGSSRRLAVGAPADVVAFAGNPRNDLTHLRRPQLVMRRGRLVTAP